MDKTQFPLNGPAMPDVQPGVTDTTMAPVQKGKTTMPNVPMGQIASSGPMITQTTNERGRVGIVLIVFLVISILTALTFVGLFIWMTIRYNEVSEDVEGQISEAVATAKYEQAVKLEEEFAIREQDPYRVFTGPVDYGQVSFRYPKTWSVYVEADAAKGGDFKAYFNPIQVDTVSNNTINALRLIIRDKAFDEVAQEYQRYIDRSDYNLSVESITVSGVAANLYTGTIPNSELSGYIVIFKVRDKTVIFQTDSVVFKSDFDKILSTVTFNA